MAAILKVGCQILKIRLPQSMRIYLNNPAKFHPEFQPDPIRNNRSPLIRQDSIAIAQ